MINIDYTEKMKKLGPIPEDMRTFWIRDDLARVEARMPYCLQCIKEGREIVAALDDMAQIIGPRVRIVPDDDLEIAKALTTSAAVLVDAEQIVGSSLSGDAPSGNLPISGSSMDGKARRDQDYVVATGRDPYEAFVALTVLEKAAEVQILSDALGGVRPIPERIARKERREYLNKYSKPGRDRREQEFFDFGGSHANTEISELSMNSESQNEPIESHNGLESISDDSFVNTSSNILEEFKERRNLVDYGKKLVEKKLVQGTWGNLSVRLDNVSDNASDEGYMLVTPSGLDYDSLGPEDMVKVDLESLDYDKSGNKPTTEMGLHAGIYNNRPDIGAIIHTHSKYCSVFAACGFPIDVMDDYLADEVAGDVIHVAEYGVSGSEILTRNVVKALGGAIEKNSTGEEGNISNEFKMIFYGRRGCILSNHGMIACAADLDTAMEVAIAMEEAARQQINRRLDKLIDHKNSQKSNDNAPATLQNPIMIVDVKEEE